MRLGAGSFVVVQSAQDVFQSWTWQFRCYTACGSHTISPLFTTESDAARQAKHAQATLTGIAGDVSTEEGAKAFCTAVDKLPVPIYALINNVGIFFVKPFWDLTDQDWQHTFNVNVFSTVRLCRHFLKGMLHRNEVIPKLLHAACSLSRFAILVETCAHTTLCVCPYV